MFKGLWGDGGEPEGLKGGDVATVKERVKRLPFLLLVFSPCGGATVIMRSWPLLTPVGSPSWGG